jgi:transcriptional regulator with XRE-family HTH domain
MPNNPIDKHVGNRVRMRRIMLQMTQTELANAVGVTFQQVQKYEKGTNRISASRLQQISGILQVPISFFFEGTPEEPGRSKANGSDPVLIDINEFLASKEGLALVDAFVRIEQPSLRRRILKLVEEIADAEDH